MVSVGIPARPPVAKRPLVQARGRRGGAGGGRRRAPASARLQLWESAPSSRF
jgi:hypothetical protein